jgi:hypothetical protein
VIEDISPKRKDYSHRLMDYKNDPGTRFADIQNVLRLLEVRIAKWLQEEPIGPQTASAKPVAPPVTGADLQIVKRAREILGSPSNWDRADTQACPAAAPSFSLFCAFERAAREVTGAFENRAAGIEEARLVVNEIAPNRDKYQSRLTDFNNDAATTFDDVQKLFQLVEERIGKRLKDRTGGK